MKKSIALVLMLLLFSTLLVSCGGSTSMGGRWELTEMIVDGQDYLALMKELAPDTDISAEMYFVFTDDGKMTTAMGEEVDGTYNVSGSKLSMSAEGESESLEATLKGNTFVIESDEEGMVGTMTYTKK